MNDYDVVKAWIDKPRASQSGNTKRQYQSFWDQFKKSVPVPLQSVRYDHLIAWREQIEQQTDSSHTLKTRVSYMKSLFSFATEIGYLKENPAKLIETPTAEDARHERILTEGEIKKILDNTKKRRDRVLIRVLYSSALRVSELLALTWKDVIPLDNGSALLIVRSGKGGKSRKVDISAQTYQALLSLRDDDADSEPIFKSNRNRALDRTVVNRMIPKAAKRAGIDKRVTPHWFRHSSLTHAWKNGADPIALQKKGGFDSLDSLLVYLHDCNPGVLDEVSTNQYLIV